MSPTSPPSVPPADTTEPLARQLSTLVRGYALVVTVLMAVEIVVFPPALRHALFILVASNLLCLAAYLLCRSGHALAGARGFVGGMLLMLFGLSWVTGGLRSPAATGFAPMVIVAGVLLHFRGGARAAAAAGLWALWLVVAEAEGWLPPPPHHTGAAFAAVILLNLSLISLTLWVATEEIQRIRLTREDALDERHRAEAALANSEQHLALALEASTDGAYDIDFTTGEVYCSPRYFTMLGYAPGELTASLETWRSLLHPDDRAEAEAAMESYFSHRAENHSIETRLRAKDGSWRWVLSRGRVTTRDAAGTPRRLIGTHVDITERKHAELALKQAKDFAEKLIATANALIVCLDHTGKIVVFNTAAEAITGYTRAELTGRNWFDTLVPRDRYPQVWDEFARLQHGGLPEHYETPILTKAGDERTIVWRNSILRDGDRTAGTISFGLDVTEHRRAEHALAKERDLVARLVETSPAGILVVDVRGQVIFANAQAEHILDLRRTAPDRHTYEPPDWELLDHDGHPIPDDQRVFRRVIASGRPIRDVRHFHCWPSGRRVLISINAAPLFDASGRIEGVVSTFDDITTRQRAEDLLRENEERLRSIVDHAPFGSHLYQLEPDGRLVFQGANHSADTILHLDHHALVGRDILDAFPGLRDTGLPEAYRRVATTGRPHHRALVRYESGGISGAFDVHVLPIDHQRIVAFFADITERERAAAALRHSEEQYRLLFNAGNDAILVLGLLPDGTPDHFSQVNDIACQLLGYPREQLLARTLLDLTPPELVDNATTTAALLHRERHALYETELLANGGHRIPVEINARQLELNGRPTILSVVRDITERHRLEGQLRQAQKMEVFGQLAGGVAHDFNNLLVAIIGNAELLLEAPDIPTRAREQLGQVHEAGRRAAALTRQLLLFARKQPPQPVPCDLNTVVADHVKLLRRIIGEDIELSVELAAAALPIQADVNMVEQVAMNLVVNARDAMPRGGALVLRTAPASLDEAAAARCGCPPGRYAALVVRDTGCGIPATIRQRIFEPFFTTKPAGHGTGLGLSTVLGIVQQHRGGLALASEEGRGTEFTIYLPLVGEPGGAGPAVPVAGATDRPATGTILVVEDDGAVRAIVEHTLRRAGYHVIVEPAAAEALARLTRDSAGFDLVLSDVVMPGGMGGVEFSEHLATLRPGLPVLLMSGYAKELERTDLRVLQKPFTITQLLAFVREGLAAGRGRHGP